MVIDARELGSGQALETDLCIVGSGPAGIALARRCARPGRAVTVLEGGGFEPDEATQDLYGGVSTGEFPTENNYLLMSRIRSFGGTGRVWSGWCRPLDTLDFDERSWVPSSGWPVARAELDPYYDEAATFCQIAPFEHTGGSPSTEPPPIALPPESGITTRQFHMSPPTRFGVTYRADLEEHPHIAVVLHANVREVRLAEGGDVADDLEVVTLGGVRVGVRARVIVLACGGVETPRLLLASRGVHRDGIGNARGLVGRFFMEHPHIEVGRFTLWGAAGRSTGLGPHTDPALGHDVLAVLCPDEATQRRERMLNTSIELLVQPWYLAPAHERALAAAGDRLDRAGARTATDTGAHAFGVLILRAEQAPNPDSRVTLDTESDPVGLPRARLDWRLSSLDRHTHERALTTLARALGMGGVGRVRRAERAPPIGTGHHHMGTTRMHVSPQYGVTDADCLVHGVRNLYVAGSALFPTSGFANPTLTLVALALRLGDHLEKVLSA